MHSGSPTTSTAVPHDIGPSSPHSTRHHPVRSPSDRPISSTTTKRKSSISSENTTKRPRRLFNEVNGDVTPDALNGHDDSEAETLRLSDEEVHKASEAKRRDVKDETADNTSRASPSLNTKCEPTRSEPDSRASSVAVDEIDKADRSRNGSKNEENQNKHGSSRPPAHTKAHSVKEADAKSRAHSVDPSSSSAQHRASRVRQALSAEPRKRKFSDGSAVSRPERPRQKARLDGPSKDRISTPNTEKSQSASVPTSTASADRQHRRSASNQSHPASGSSAPSRSRHDTLSIASDDKRNYDDSSSEPASPRPPPIPLLAPPRSKASTRALASPARAAAMPHGKKTDKFGLTSLARACEKGKLNAVKSAYEQAPDELDFVDNAGYAPLQKAALEGHADIVEFLLGKGCRTDCQSKNQDTPLIDAVENCHVDVVRILLAHGVNPHHQNDRGQRAIDLVDHDQDEADEMEALLHKSMISYEGPGSDDEKPTETLAPLATRGERKDLLHKENTPKTLTEYAQRGDIEAVDYFLNMRVKPNMDCCVVAARGGHVTVLNLLLVDVADKDPDPASHEETPLLAAIGRGHIGVLKLLLNQEGFNPCRRTREGRTYWEIAEERHGPRWQAERDLLKDRFDQYRASHPGKSAKKKRPDALNGTNHGRTNPSIKIESKTTKPKSPILGNKVKVKADKSEDAPKRRLLSAREISMKDRRRRVVHEESSAGSSDDEDLNEARAKAKNPGKRQKSSAVRKPPRQGNDNDEQAPQPKRMEKVEKQEKIERTEKSAGRKSQPGASPRTERRKRAGSSHDKVLEKAAEHIHSPDVEGQVSPQAPAKQETPEAVHEERRVARTAEIERIQREKEEAEARKAEEERRQEEEERRQEEEERRREEEERRQAEEERRQKEEERLRKEEEVRKRRERLESLPTALRFALEHGPDRPLTYTPSWSKDPDRAVDGIDSNFLPILQWPLSRIDPDCSANSMDEKWIMSFQVVGLFGLPEMGLAEFPDWEKRCVPKEQRELFLRGYCIDKLASFYHFDPDDMLDEMDVEPSVTTDATLVPLQTASDSSGTANGRLLKLDTSLALTRTTLKVESCAANARLDEFYNAIEDTKSKFMNMQPLYYVRYDDFIKALPQYPHLNGLEITCCRGPPIRQTERHKWVDHLRKTSTPGVATPTSTTRAATPNSGSSKPGTPKGLAPAVALMASSVDCKFKENANNTAGIIEKDVKTVGGDVVTPANTVGDADVKVEDVDSPATDDGMPHLSNPIKAMVEGVGDDDADMADA